MFFVLWLVDQGKMDPGKLTGRAAELFAMAGKKRPKSQRFHRLKPETKVIVIPPRPFLARAIIHDVGFRNEAQEIWTEAVRATLKEQAKGGERI